MSKVNCCPICGSENLEDLIYHQNNYKCKECGHLFKGGMFNYDWYKIVDYWYKDSPETLRRYQKMFYAVFEDFVLPGNTLEIGAADGDFLYHVNKHFPDNKITYSELTDICRKEYNDFISEKIIGDFTKLEFNSTTYKNIFLNDVIEHFDNIWGSMDKLMSLMETGSRLFIITNNGDFLNAHNELIYHQEHINIFTAKSWEIFTNKYPLKELLHFNSPQGLSFMVMEKL